MFVTIRLLSIDDANISWKWRNDPNIWKYTGDSPKQFVTVDIEREWLKEVLSRENECRFAICIGEEKEYIGNIQLTDIIEKTAQLHIFIGESKYHSKGIGTQSTKLLIDYARKKLNLKYIYLYVNPNNSSAIKMYEKCCFRIVENLENQLKMAIDL